VSPIPAHIPGFGETCSLATVFRAAADAMTLRIGGALPWSLRSPCFTIAQASELVGLTKQMASFLDLGWNGKHEPCEPRRSTRKLMMAAALGYGRR
jgi:hypothetical protein